MARTGSYRAAGSGTEAARRRLYAAGGVALVIAALAWGFSFAIPAPDVPVVSKTHPVQENAPMCPWRDPEGDLRAFFPGATSHRTETLILSAQRVELARRLGRPPAQDEHSLRLYPVYQGERPVGCVLTRRVKGEFGALEMVLAVGQDGRVRGLRLQRQREPEAVARALADPAWLRSFEGKTADDPWRLGEDVPQVAPVARVSAAALVEATRGLLILRDVAVHSGVESAPHHPTDSLNGRGR